MPLTSQFLWIEGELAPGCKQNSHGRGKSSPAFYFTGIELRLSSDLGPLSELSLIKSVLDLNKFLAGIET